MLCWGSTRIGQEAFCWIHSCLRVLPFPPRRARRLHRCELFSKRTMTPHSAAPTESQPSDGSWTVQSCPVTQPTFCPFTKRVIRPHRRGCNTRIPLGGSPASPTRHARTRIGALASRGRARVSVAPPASPAPSDGLASLLVVRLPSSSRLVTFHVGLGCWAGRSDARSSSSGRCPAPAASGGVLASGDAV